MIIRTPEGGTTTTDDVIAHPNYPCPPSRHPGISCEEALERWAVRTGRTVVAQGEEEEDRHAE